MFIRGQLARLDMAFDEEHVREEETIQLINFYGKQIIDKLDSEANNHGLAAAETTDELPSDTFREAVDVSLRLNFNMY